MDKDVRIISTVTIKGKEYQVRGLDFDDVEILSLLLDKTDFDFAKYETEAKVVMNGGENAQSGGISFFLKVVTDIVKKYHKAHKEFSQFVSSLIGVTPEELKKMPITTPIKVLKELAKDEDSLDFFSLLRQ